MNRSLFCIILLLISHTVLAEKLYRWVEADGSITFSPNPPPSGVDYKAVNAAHNNAAKADLPKPASTPSILATSEHGLDTDEPKTAAAKITVQPEVEAERQKLSYAPDIGNKTTTQTSPAAATQKPIQPRVSQAEITSSNKKRRHCQDLNKRVMSLERRLRSPLKPVDMDNTVVAMARYQRSYDQHCID